MNKYVRVMHPAEADMIQHNGIIPTNREDWGDHKAGTVVFLFEADRVSWAYIYSRAEDIVEKLGSAVILSFRCCLSCAADQSGWDQGGAVVHYGTLSMNEVVNPQWRTYSMFAKSRSFVRQE